MGIIAELQSLEKIFAKECNRLTRETYEMEGQLKVLKSKLDEKELERDEMVDRCTALVIRIVKLQNSKKQSCRA